MNSSLRTLRCIAFARFAVPVFSTAFNRKGRKVQHAVTAMNSQLILQDF
jgi:hypothetical protein